MSLFDCEPTLSGVRTREELEKLVYGRPAHDAAMPTDEAEARRYPATARTSDCAVSGGRRSDGGPSTGLVARRRGRPQPPR
jgi:hypothetical protein